MKLLRLIISLFSIVCFFSCDNETPDIKNADPSYFLRGILNGLNSIELEYFELEDASKFISSSHTPSFGASDSPPDYYEESIHLTFNFTTNGQERLELRFNFKFDKSNTPWGYLSYIEGIYHLEELMNEGDWGYKDNYYKTTKSVDVTYTLFSHMGVNLQYGSYCGPDSLSNTISDFNIDKIEKYEDFRNGEVLLINGSFDCVLYNRDDQEDFIKLRDMKFQGFVKQTFCGRDLCE